MRIDKIRRAKAKGNVINLDLALLNPKYDNSEKPYGDKSWIIDPQDSSLYKIHLYKIFDNEDFSFYLQDLKDIRFYFSNEVNNQSFSTLATLCHQLKDFSQYLKENNRYLHLNEIGFNNLLEYGNYLKVNNIKKARHKFGDIKKLLVGLKKYSIKMHDDVENNCFPNISFLKNITPKEGFYSKEEYTNLSKTIVEIILDYFKGTAPEHLFVKSSFWLMAFCTGFNATGVKSLKTNSFSILEENNDSITYLVVGEKNRSNNGYQKAIIKLNKNEENTKIFTKTINRLKDLSKEISAIAKSIDRDFLFLSYRYGWKNQEINKNSYFRYFGEDFDYNKYAKFYFEKNNAQNLSFSTRKIRNQYSLEFFNLSKNEEFVSKVMNHSNVKTTMEYYMKFKLSDKMIIKFQLFQELLVKFANSEEIDWSLYQKSLNIENRPLEILLKDFSSGVFDTPMGHCLNKEDANGNVCDSYIKCFSCKNYSLISDKDLWKVYSFKETLKEHKSDSKYYREHYQPIIESIDEFISSVDKTHLLDLRKKYQEHGKHPFWKNPIMLKQITHEYEESL